MINKTIVLCWREKAIIQCVMYKDDLEKLKGYIGNYFNYKEVSVLDKTYWTVYENSEFYTFYGDEYLYHESSADGYSYDVFLNERRHSMVIAAENTEWQLYYSFRMIRNLLRWIIYDDTVICLHGGAVTLRNKGILLLGNKKSGKTSTILSMLINMDAYFVTNDDVMIQRKERFISLGWPRAISIRKDTLQILGLNSADDMKHHKHPNNVFITENCINSENEYYLPQEIVSFGNGQIVPESPIHIVIFPSFIGDSEVARIEKLEKPELVKKLQENLIEYPEKYCKFLRGVFNSPSKEQIEKNLNGFCDYIEGFNLYQKFNELDRGSRFINSLID